MRFSAEGMVIEAATATGQNYEKAASIVLHTHASECPKNDQANFRMGKTHSQR
jgi:hypothetical protein